MAVTIAIAGAGDRGETYGSYALQHPDRAKVVAVAEPREFHRKHLAKLHSIPEDRIFESFEEMAVYPALADSVIIATPDNMHTAPALAFLSRGYAILLEKPMAPTAHECIQIKKAALDSGSIFAVCHVLRYTPYTVKLKEMIASGTVGEVVSVQHLEPVGYWHQAHSFVRGNWRNTLESSFMLLAKSCHDMDWLRFIVNKPCRQVSSFGSLKYFKPDRKPAGSSDRCITCRVESSCPYSAVKIYFGLFKQGRTGWPVSVVCPEPAEEKLRTALENGPYGRCVFACDNDVVDNQVMNLLFDDEITATFTMTAFTKAASRKTRVFGTRGEIEGDGRYIKLYDFLTDTERVTDTAPAAPSGMAGHGGGDYGMMEAFTEAVAAGDQSLVSSGPEVSLESHLMAFAGELSRLENRVVSLQELQM